MRRAASGSIVLWSITNEPDRAPRAIPRSPRSTASTAAESVTIVMMMSLVVATCAGDSPAIAPAVTSGAIASGRRAHTVTVWLWLNRLRAIGAPMVPSPTNPMVVICVAAPDEVDFRVQPLLIVGDKRFHKKSKRADRPQVDPGG